MSGAASVVLADRRRSPRALRELSDERLARLVGAGDPEAFAVIYDRHHQALYRYCNSILQNAQDAADALQNAMVKALRALPGERRHIALKPWLYRLAHNESISLLRKRRPEEELSQATAVGCGSVEGDFAARDRLSQLVSDLRELPDRQRGALLMRELSGLDYSDIAVVLAVSSASAKQAVYEARMSLQVRMEGRETGCDSVRRTISAHDGRRLRDRGVHAHLRDCAACRDFEAAIAARQRQLTTIAPPLPATAAAALLQNVLGAAGGGTGGGLAAGGLGAVGGGTGGGLAAGGLGAVGGLSGFAAKASVAAAVATVGVGGIAAGGAAVLGGGDRASTRAAAARPVQAVQRERPRVRTYTDAAPGGALRTRPARVRSAKKVSRLPRPALAGRPGSAYAPAARGTARGLSRGAPGLTRSRSVRRRAGRARPTQRRQRGRRRGTHGVPRGAGPAFWAPPATACVKPSPGPANGPHRPTPRTRCAPSGHNRR